MSDNDTHQKGLGKAAASGGAKTIILTAAGAAAVLVTVILILAVAFVRSQSPKESCAEGEDCSAKVRAYEQETLPDITDLSMDWPTETPSSVPKESGTPIDETKGAHSASLQSCAKLEASAATSKAKDWLITKGMDLANKLPGSFSGWASSGVQFGSGSLSSLQDPLSGTIDQDVTGSEGIVGDGAGTGMSLTVELVIPSETDPNARWVFRIISSLADQSAGGEGVTPIPTQAEESNGGSYSYFIRAEEFDTETGQWVPVCEDVLTTVEAGPTPAGLVTPSAEPTVKILINARCRLGPSLDYPVVSFFSQGDVLHPTGRNQEATWCQVPMNTGSGVCWLAGNLTEPNCSQLNLSYAPAPPLPTATPAQENQSQPQTGCWVTNNPNYPNGVCLPRACESNDFPGTSCTP